MTDTPYISGKVSVIIPVYNEERFLREALDSVVHQVDCVIIGDNASTDGTEAICREYEKKYPHVVYFRNEKNLGSILNCVRCYERVQTEYVFHMGGHDLVSENYVQNLKALLLKHPDAIGAFGDAFSDKRSATGKGVSVSGAMKRGDRWRWKKFLKNSLDPNPFLRCYYYVAALSWLPIYGIFRSEPFLPLATNIQRISGPECVVLFGSLLQGGIAYDADVSYYRRNVHIEESGDDSYDDAMLRVHGESDGKVMDGEDEQPLYQGMMAYYGNHCCPEFAHTKIPYGILLYFAMANRWQNRADRSFLWRIVFSQIIPLLKSSWKKSWPRHLWRTYRNSIPFFRKKKKKR